MRQNAQSGFSLMEMLLVIAILGILTSIVLVRVNSARYKANDAKIQSNINQLRKLAEVIYASNYTSYGGVRGVEACYEAAPSADNTTCAGNVAEGTNRLVQDLTDTGGTDILFDSVGNSFCLKVTLNDGVTVTCVDSSGLQVKDVAANIDCAENTPWCT